MLTILIRVYSNNVIENAHKQIPIDDYFDRALYPRLQSFSSTLPLVTQKYDFSDINKTMDSNHYLMTYNWNVYCPDKLENKYLEYNKCVEMKNNNES